MTKDIRAAYRPQEAGPKPWIVLIDGEPLRDRRGELRRFKEATSAKRAGEAACLTPAP
ncbi:MAG TPA: hypothetical protein VJP88_08640 [Caulobacteraceae bacterium]|nr:hypothetical protein [Caulobacteraceae bacterium]